jgi:hypothetical protein
LSACKNKGVGAQCRDPNPPFEESTKAAKKDRFRVPLVTRKLGTTMIRTTEAADVSGIFILSEDCDQHDPATRRPTTSLRYLQRRLSGSCSTGASDRQHTPKCCQSRNHGLWANASSCLRFAAEMSLALSGLMSGASNISCSCSMSLMMRSTSMRLNIQHKQDNGQTTRQQLRVCGMTDFSKRVSAIW